MDELRLDFAAQGLPASGRIGFEIFDRTAFGATEFLEHVNYRRALEGEIARTIATISEVGGARVHIAMPKESLFSEHEQPAKASVVLKLQERNRPLAPATVTGIARLVAASVEGLRPGSGRHRRQLRPSARAATGRGRAALDGLQLERQQRIEHDLTQRVVSLLEPVVGEDRVRVNVTVRLNTQSQEETEERWDSDDRRPQPADHHRRDGRQLGAAAGPAPSPAPGATASASRLAGWRRVAGGETPARSHPPLPRRQASTLAASRAAETTNYEVSKPCRHTVRPRGDVARLSVAVHRRRRARVDQEAERRGHPGRQAADAGRPAEDPGHLVAAAVGLDTTRGDQLTVENIAFENGADRAASRPTGTVAALRPAGDGCRAASAVGRPARPRRARCW